MNRGSRHKGMARLRRSLRPELVLAGVVFAGFLAFQTWSEHRLDTLRQVRLEFDERLASAQSGLARAELEFDRESEQTHVVQRARAELGFVDAEVNGRARLALPAPEMIEPDPLLWRLAGGLDRFGGIREALASDAADAEARR